MSRPEYQLPADVFYGADEARRYARSSRMHAIQTQLAERALELLLLPCRTLSSSSAGLDCDMESSADEQAGGEQQKSVKQQPSLLLDLGVGSGISASTLVERGHFVVGVDISRFMLQEAVERGTVEERTDVLLADLGQRMNFRTAIFDGAISISAIQWLCSGVQSAPLEAPPTFAEAGGTGTAGRGNTTCTTVQREEALTTTAAKRTPTEETKNLQGPSRDAEAGDATRWRGSDAPGSVSGDETLGVDREEEETQRNTQVVMLTAKPSQKGEGALTRADGGRSKSNTPYGRLRRFFAWLYSSLRPGARAALQFYPDSTQQVETITAAALRAGFNGGLVVDYPNSTKAKKHFLVLWVGGGRMSTAEQQLQLQNAAVDSGPQDHVHVAQRERQKRIKRRGNKAGGLSRRQWIMRKKERQRLQGKEVRHDSKYMGRKRKDKF